MGGSVIAMHDGCRTPSCLSLTTTGIPFVNSARCTFNQGRRQRSITPPSYPQRPIVVIYSLTPSYSPSRERKAPPPQTALQKHSSISPHPNAPKESLKRHNSQKRKQAASSEFTPSRKPANHVSSGKVALPAAPPKTPSQRYNSFSVHRTIRQPRRDVVFGSPLSKVYYVWNKKKSSRPFLVYTVENYLPTNQH